MLIIITFTFSMVLIIFIDSSNDSATSLPQQSEETSETSPQEPRKLDGCMSLKYLIFKPELAMWEITIYIACKVNELALQL